MFDKNDSKDIAIPEGLLTKGTQTVITGSIITNANTRNGVTYESKNLVITSSDPLT